jgi:membrane protein required for colicin V production
LRIVAAWVSIFIVVLVLMSLLRLAVRGLLKALGLSLSDRLLGFVFGAARGLIIVLVIVAVAGMTMVPKEKWWSDAYFSAPLETAVLAGKPWLPPEVSKRIRFR